MDSRQITRLTRRSVRVRDTPRTLAASYARPPSPTRGRVGDTRGHRDCEASWVPCRRDPVALGHGRRAAPAVARRRRGRRRRRGAPPDDPATVRALAYPALVGEPGAGRPGAAQRQRARARASAPAGTPWSSRCPTGCRRRPSTGPGHVVKARYTPLQAIVLAADEEASPHRAALADATDSTGMPVVTADLHSALPGDPRRRARRRGRRRGSRT